MLENCSRPVVVKLDAAQHLFTIQTSSVTFCALFLTPDIELVPRNLQYADEMIIVRIAFTFPPKRFRL
jgi:hypothetical protein